MGHEIGRMFWHGDVPWHGLGNELAGHKLHNARAILHDLRTLGESLWRRFSGSAEQIGRYYGGLANAFAARLTDAEGRALVTELDTALRAIGQLSPAFADGLSIGRGGGGCPDRDPAGIAA